MKNTIIEKIINIEKELQVKILYAIEAGSRAVGYASESSDYDVRFIYIHPPNWYLTIDPQGIGQKRDVIEYPINESLDINGWEITKALRLFRKGNPQILEWLSCNEVYVEDRTFYEKLKGFEREVFSPITSLRHYINMATSNYRKHLQGNEVKTKIYFYVLRSILACRWIERKQSIPPINIRQLLQEMVREVEVKEEIEHLLNRKVSGDKFLSEPPISVLNDFIENEIVRMEGYIQTLIEDKKDITEKLNGLFQETLWRVWGGFKL